MKKNCPDKYLSKNMRELRESRKLTINEFCKKFNSAFDSRLNKSTVSRYENGLQEPMTSTVNKIAQFYNVNIEVLLGYRSLDDFYGVSLDLNDEEILLILAYKIANDHDRDIVKAALKKYKSASKSVGIVKK